MLEESEIRDVGDGYGVDRYYPGLGGPEFTNPFLGNVFGGEMLCGETDQFPEDTASCAYPADQGGCCDHPYQCLGAPVP